MCPSFGDVAAEGYGDGPDRERAGVWRDNLDEKSQVDCRAALADGRWVIVDRVLARVLSVLARR